MKKIELDLMKGYRYLSALNKAYGETIFIDTIADMENNDYIQTLHTLDKTFYSAKRINYDIIDGEIYLKENNGDFTDVFRLTLDGKKEKLFSLPLAVGSIRVLNDDLFLVDAGITMGCPDYFMLDQAGKDAYKAKVKANEDYLVLDEYPFFYNGAGFINGDRTNLFIVNRKDFSVKRIVPATMDCENIDICDGKAIFFGNDYTAMKDMYSSIYCYDAATDTLTELFHNAKEIYFRTLHFLNGKIYVYGNKHSCIDGSNIYTVEDGKLNLVLETEWMFFNSVGSDCHYGRGKSKQRDGKYMYMVTVDHNHACLMRFDGTTLCKLTDFEGDISDFLIEGDKITIISLYDMKLQEVYEVIDGMPKALTHINDAILEGRYVSKPEKYTVFNIDEIEGWAMKPIDFDPNKKYPCILDIHGGPKSAYGEVFTHEMEVWASLGYFVIYCNPHCSDGRGNDFADYLKHYGANDFDDLMKFVDKALELYPQIDPERLGVTGGSYGGYMTNWIITHTNRFKCAASQRSISNRVADFFYSDYSYDTTHENAVPLDDEFLKMSWDRSPIKYWQNANTPTLFIQSTCDYRCPFPEALQLFSALKFKGVEARLCGFKGENHELSRSGKPTHRLRRLQEITDWMESHLK